MNKARRIKRFKFPKKTRNNKGDESGILCEVEWYRDQEGKLPEPRLENYEYLRSNHKMLLLNYYEKHLVLI